MTATALAFDTAFDYDPALDFDPAFDFDPALDFFDDVDAIAPARPQLRLIEGGGYRTVAAAARPVAIAPPRPAASTEIYRRRRFLALVAVSVLILGLAWAAGVSILSFGSSATAAVGDAPAASSLSVHTILPGDSYAAIAADFGAADPVIAAEQIRLANGGGELVVGQRLVVDLATLQAG